jgi:hypothetical protein
MPDKKRSVPLQRHPKALLVRIEESHPKEGHSS